MFSGVSPFATMNIAMSPTILDDGVTLMMSPSMSLTFLYINFTSSNFSPSPNDSTCGLRLEYCPPGIS